MALALLLPVLLLLPTSLSVSAQTQPNYHYASQISQINLKIAHLGNHSPLNTSSYVRCAYICFFFVYRFPFYVWELFFVLLRFIRWNNLNAESVLEESNTRLKERDAHLEECERRMNELSEKIHHLHSTLSAMKVFLPL